MRRNYAEGTAVPIEQAYKEGKMLPLLPSGQAQLPALGPGE